MSTHTHTTTTQSATPPDLQACWQQAAPPLEKRLETARYQALAAYLKTPQTQADSPCLMLYGVYNAGKSTLVNALLGQDVAQVGWIPTTDCLQRYEGSGYTLLDSPGIDAPIAHEAISREQLRVADMLLWVMFSDTGAHEDNAYHEILDLHAQGKRILIVVNTEDIDLQDYAQRQACVDEIYARLQRVARRRGDPAPTLAGLPVCWINAKNACRARLTGKPTLLAKSGYPQLVDTLDRFLANTDAQARQRARVGALQTAIDDALSQTPHQARSGDTHDYLHDLQRRLDQTREQMEQALTQVVREQRLALERVYRTQMHAVADQGDAGIAEVETVLSRQLDDAETALERALAQALAQAAQRLDHALQAGRERKVTETVSTSLASAVPTTVAGEQNTPKEGEQDMASRLAGMSTLVGHLERDNITAILAGVKKVLPQLMKGIGPVTMGRMADTFLKSVKVGGPVLMTGIQLAQSLYQHHQAQQQAAEQRAAIERFHQQVQEGARELGQRYQAAADAVIAEAIDTALQPLEREVQQQLTACQVDTREIDTLRDIYQRLSHWLSMTAT